MPIFSTTMRTGINNNNNGPPTAVRILPVQQHPLPSVLIQTSNPRTVQEEEE